MHARFCENVVCTHELLALFVTTRVRRCLPPPHRLEQSDHLEIIAPTLHVVVPTMLAGVGTGTIAFMLPAVNGSVRESGTAAVGEVGAGEGAMATAGAYCSRGSDGCPNPPSSLSANPPRPVPVASVPPSHCANGQGAQGQAVSSRHRHHELRSEGAGMQQGRRGSLGGKTVPPLAARRTHMSCARTSAQCPRGTPCTRTCQADPGTCPRDIARRQERACHGPPSWSSSPQARCLGCSYQGRTAARTSAETAPARDQLRTHRMPRSAHAAGAAPADRLRTQLRCWRRP